MEEQIEKLINHAGGAGRYQILILIIGFFIYSSLSFHNTSLAMLETVPQVKLKGEKEVQKLNYDICDKGKDKYDIVESFGFSWIIEMDIVCDKAKVGLIGTFINLGLTAGSLLFSFMTKYLTHRDLIRIFVFVYVFFLFLMTVVDNYGFGLFCLFCLGIGNGMANTSVMTLVSESVSSNKRPLFQGIINVGLSFCPIMYTPLFVLFGKWRFAFWLQNVIGIGFGIIFIIIGENSPRMYFSKNQTEEAIEVLRKIAGFNGKLKEFDEMKNDKEFDSLLRNEEEGVEKNLTVEMKPKYGYSALLKYKSVRYKFLIFTFMFMSTTFLTIAVVINMKTMEGNVYLIIVSLYTVEVVSGVSCSFLINLPSIGRKKSLIIFYLGMTSGFVLTLIFSESAVGCWLAMVLIRYCITAVYTTFFIFFMESYPTPLRSLGFGLNSTFGNLAGVVSPMIIEYMDKYFLYAIFAFLCGFNIFFTFFLKETVGKPMLETIEELEVPDIEKDKLVPGRESDAKNLEKGADSDKKEPLLNNTEEEKKDEEKKDEETKDEEKKDEEKKDEEKKDEEKKDEEKKEGDEN